MSNTPPSVPDRHTHQDTGHLSRRRVQERHALAARVGVGDLVARPRLAGRDGVLEALRRLDPGERGWSAHLFEGVSEGYDEVE